MVIFKIKLCIKNCVFFLEASINDTLNKGKLYMPDTKLYIGIYLPMYGTLLCFYSNA